MFRPVFTDQPMQKTMIREHRDESADARIRVTITRKLANGMTNADDAAAALGISPEAFREMPEDSRRKFLRQLSSTREILARTYVRYTTINDRDIAYILGYDSAEDFRRAFLIWTGISPAEYRKTRPSGKAPVHAEIGIL